MGKKVTFLCCLSSPVLLFNTCSSHGDKIIGFFFFLMLFERLQNSNLGIHSLDQELVSERFWASLAGAGGSLWHGSVSLFP